MERESMLYAGVIVAALSAVCFVSNAVLPFWPRLPQLFFTAPLLLGLFQFAYGVLFERYRYRRPLTYFACAVLATIFAVVLACALAAVIVDLAQSNGTGSIAETMVYLAVAFVLILAAAMQLLLTVTLWVLSVMTRHRHRRHRRNGHVPLIDLSQQKSTTVVTRHAAGPMALVQIFVFFTFVALGLLYVWHVRASGITLQLWGTQFTDGSTAPLLPLLLLWPAVCGHQVSVALGDTTLDRLARTLLVYGLLTTLIAVVTIASPLAWLFSNGIDAFVATGAAAGRFLLLLVSLLALATGVVTVFQAVKLHRLQLQLLQQR